MADQRTVYLNSLARSPIGATHGWLSGWHPADLLRTVIDALFATTDVPTDHIDRIIIANATPVGALANISRSTAVAAEWPATTQTLEITAGRTSGQQALGLGRELIAHGASNALVVCSIDFASLVPPGAPLLRREYGKPWTPDSQRAFNQSGATLPDGPYADTLDIARADQDAYAVLQHERADADTGLLAIERRVADPERATPLLGDPFNADQMANPQLDPATVDAAEPIFADDGTTTAANSSQPGDGAVALLLTAAEGRHIVEPTAVHHGLPTDPIEPAVAATRPLLPAATLALSEFTAAHIVTAADRLDVPTSAINPHGGAIARGRLDGGELLAALHDLVALEMANDLVVASMSGDGAAVASRIHRA